MNPKLDDGEKGRRVAVTREVMGRQIRNEIEQVQLETDAKIRRQRIEANEDIKEIESLVRVQALIIPPLLPLAVGLMVLGFRLLGEQRGIAKERMVKGLHR
ncbi:MAG: hypothetical protein R3B90_07925 [Planctomycetaceae bacterium]